MIVPHLESCKIKIMIFSQLNPKYIPIYVLKDMSYWISCSTPCNRISLRHFQVTVLTQYNWSETNLSIHHIRLNLLQNIPCRYNMPFLHLLILVKLFSILVQPILLSILLNLSPIATLSKDYSQLTFFLSFGKQTNTIQINKQNNSL